MDLESQEWLEPDGLGGFASGTAASVRTRRYHALLLSAERPPTGRRVLVNGLDAWVELNGDTLSISSQRYTPDVIAPDRGRAPAEFSCEPWPTWRFTLPGGVTLRQEIFVVHGAPLTVVTWTLEKTAGDGKAVQADVKLCVRPFLSGRDYHSMHHENAAFNFTPQIDGPRIAWTPYSGVPEISLFSNGEYQQRPHWYRSFLYREEAARGLDAVEDLAAPGVLEFSVAPGGTAALLLTTDPAAVTAGKRDKTPIDQLAQRLAEKERQRRKALGGALERCADAYLVRRGSGLTVIAGYPWFADWGRDTFIALRGLCLATGRFDDARRILTAWADLVSEGMLPNRFPDSPSDQPEFNSIDASLWFVVAAAELIQACDAGRKPLADADAQRLWRACSAIVRGYAAGTRYRIRMDEDGLLVGGEPGVQLTWMDAKVGDWVVTPRIGKPVELQALWINALTIVAAREKDWAGPLKRAKEAFQSKFWNEERNALYDVIDVDHERGRVDSSLRPNQIFAVGGLPVAILDGDRARRVVDTVERTLLTPIGLRSLAPSEPGYTPHYEGGVRERDGAYHQGTVWPWLIGPFVEAWLRVRGNSASARAEARERFLPPLREHLREAGLGHVSEIADAESPHTPRGCPFQAWSLGELIRLERAVLQ